jgi:uncharacterized protein YhjY with autotransporter beta-barrel domain
LTVVTSGFDIGALAGVRIANAGSGGASFTNNGGLVDGDKYGVYASTATSATINNNGYGHIYGGKGFAIDVAGGGAVVNNAAHAVIQGYAHFGDGPTTVNNAGLWAAYGETMFGAATTDTVNNSGAIVVAPFSSAATTVSWTGLEAFNNQGGLVDLRNGHAGDVLNLGSATFNGSTVGSAPSRLAIDASLTANLSADSLVIGAATGTTEIVLHDVAPGAIAGINLTGVTVVNATSGTGSEFSLAGGPIKKGFVIYKLVFESTTSDWNLVGAPAQTGYELLKAPEAAQAFWRHSADAWSERESTIRDSVWGSDAPSRGQGWELWAQGDMGNEKLTRVQTFPIGGAVTTQNLGASSQWGGFQAGVDNRVSDAWLWGLTAGFIDQSSHFHMDGNGLDLTGWNFGAYGGLTAGRFFLNGLVKADNFRLLANMHTFPAIDTLSGESFGGKAETGFRIGGAGFYVEPLADIAWSTTHLDHANFPILATDFKWDDSQSLRGSIGARVGGQFGALAPYVGFYAVDEFRGDNRMEMITGACPSACTSITDFKPGAYGRADFGVTTSNWHGLSAFVKGQVEFSHDTKGFDGSLGVRWSW